MEHLKYPIGKFQFNQQDASIRIDELIGVLEALPDKLSAKLNTLVASDLEQTYRPQGWTVRQVVHHLSDSHANMYIRVKSALATPGTAIMGYDEAKWATFADNDLPLEISLQLISSIHRKITYVFKQFERPDWEKSYFHNGEKREFTLLEVLALYAWHSEHHLAHIDLAIKN